jgi:hypothetical protein
VPFNVHDRLAVHHRGDSLPQPDDVDSPTPTHIGTCAHYEGRATMPVMGDEGFVGFTRPELP